MSKCISQSSNLFLFLKETKVKKKTLQNEYGMWIKTCFETMYTLFDYTTPKAFPINSGKKMEMPASTAIIQQVSKVLPDEIG